MILHTEGSINPYYAQTLCLLFFPGAKFGESEKPSPENPEAFMTLSADESGHTATARILFGDKAGEGRFFLPHESYADLSDERRGKIAVGRAVLEAGNHLLGYLPPWGVLTGVRPSKVATELIEAVGGVYPARRVLREEYFVNPKKAALAVSVASTEMKLMRRLPDQSGLCSVYISIPFCPSRCAYCSFVSGVSGRLLSLIDDYLVSLMRDIDNMFSIIRSLGLRVATVYVGGGTPTVLDEKQLASLLSHIGRYIHPDELMEYTVEAGRPDTITREKLAVLHTAGVSRISVNPQTLSDEILTRIGRRHTVADFYRAYEIAATSGIGDINVDLIAGLPGDNFENFSKSMDSVLALSPTNITVHSFTVKNAASIRHSGEDLYSLSGGDAAKSVEYAHLRTKNAGYKPYYMYRQKNTVGNLENVGYSFERHEGLYNIFMMEELHSIFSVGAGAVTKLVAQPKEKGAPRTMKRIFTPKYPYEYLRDADKIRLGDAAEGRASIGDQISAFYRDNF